MPTKASILSRLHLQGLRHFEAVVRELKVTPGAVSQHIRWLEDGLDMSLFHQQGNRSQPTDTARQIARTLSEVLEQIEQALEIGTGKAGATAVTIKVYQTWANRWLILRLESFSQSCPDISVEFETGIESLDAGWGDLDMALCMRPEDSPDHTCVPLFTPHLLAVGTPAVAERLGPEVDLSRTTRIASRNRMEDWPNWMVAAGLSIDDSKPLMVFSNSTFVYEAALAGNGVAVAQLELVLQDLADGRLVQPVPTVIEAASPIELLRPVSRVRRSAARLFHDRLVAEAGVLRARTHHAVRVDAIVGCMGNEVAQPVIDVLNLRGKARMLRQPVADADQRKTVFQREHGAHGALVAALPCAGGEEDHDRQRTCGTVRQVDVVGLPLVRSEGDVADDLHARRPSGSGKTVPLCCGLACVWVSVI